MNRPFEFTGRIRSFRYAIRGILLMIRTQHNAWIHTVITIVGIIAGLLFHLSAAEWCWLILATTSLWTAEALNTAFEFLADATTKEFHPIVAHAKDVAAGAVLLTAIGTASIALIVFIPHLSALLAPAR